MIEHKIGDLFSNTEGYIVHGCNGQGVMGSGVARIVRDYFPAAFKAYIESGHGLGTNSYSMHDKLIIVNAVTQDFYGRDGNRYTDYDAVRQCFKELAEYAQDQDVPKVVNFPLIGCGLGGGDWSIVASIIDNEIDDSFKKVLWTLE